MRRVLLLLSVLLTALVTSLPVAEAQVPTYPLDIAINTPKVVALPDGWMPEGITVGNHKMLYAGSRRHGGIYEVSLETGLGRTIYAGRQGGAATGLKFDPRTGYLFASGAGNGDLYVFQAATGNVVASFKLAQTPGPTFINDVVITPRAAFLTDSMRPVLYRVPLGIGGTLPEQGEIEALPLSGDYTHQTGFNANGIEATSNGDNLIIVQSNTGRLFKVDPANGKAARIEIGEPVSGDGLLLAGQILYAVRGTGEVMKLELASNFLSGRLLTRLTHPGFDTPTTIARAADKLWVVNGRFSAGGGMNVTNSVVSMDDVSD